MAFIDDFWHNCAWQSKKEIEHSLRETTSSKDSIQKLFNLLAAKNDSLTTVCLSYDTMYKIIKEKIVQYDFKPSDIGKIIDTLHLNRDSVIMKNRTKFAVMMDSVKRILLWLHAQKLKYQIKFSISKSLEGL